jgi:uncharacterized protein YbjQ (UPF0145 family)
MVAPLPSGPTPAPIRTAPEPAHEAPVHVVVDLTDDTATPRLTLAENGTAALTWGAGWGDAAQGWVTNDAGTLEWRPIVTSAERVDPWIVGTHLGVVTGEAAVEVHGGSLSQLGATLAQARSTALAALGRNTLVSGGHGVIGARIEYTPFGGRLLVTATGTAVTLRTREPR